MSRRLVPVGIIMLGGMFGGTLGWFLPLPLVADAFFFAFLSPLTSACGMWVGMLAGYVLARAMEPPDRPGEVP
jgi:hypothetical protein